MGDSLNVQTGELGKFAGNLRDSATTVTNTAKNVSNNMFGVGMKGQDVEAGRNYAKQGKSVNDGLQNIADWLTAWGSAANALADAVGASVVQYSNTDVENANNQQRSTNSV